MFSDDELIERKMNKILKLNKNIMNIMKTEEQIQHDKQLTRIRAKIIIITKKQSKNIAFDNISN